MFVLTVRKNINVSCGLTTLELSLKLAQQKEFRNENRETVFWHCVQTRYLSEPDWTYWHLTLKPKKIARSQCSLQVGTSTNVCTDGSNNMNVSITIIFHSSSVSQSESVATKSGKSSSSASTCSSSLTSTYLLLAFFDSSRKRRASTRSGSSWRSLAWTSTWSSS